ncbi:MAG: DUF6371 domain-containing protein [Paludibacteraceae bacterium]
MYATPYLQKYKGKATRHTCPECGIKESFTLYLDGNTHQPIHSKVGICNRAVKCGYHYTPKQYFLDHPSDSTDAVNRVSNTHHINPPKPLQPIGTIPFNYVERSASYRSNFVRFLCEIMTEQQISFIGDNYALGATKNKEVIFWQIDYTGKVRTGKIMQYNPETGRRIKHESGAIDWIHNKLKKEGTLAEDFNLQQCFFGEHLLKIYPDATVCIVESEKSALISAAIFTEEIWLATGGLCNLTIDKCQALRGRTVILYPDLNAYEKWNEKATQIRNSIDIDISVSTLLEEIATPEAKEQGLDVADFMISHLINNNSNNTTATTETKEEPTIPPPAPARFTPRLEAMIVANPAVLTFIDNLDLIEC